MDPKHKAIFDAVQKAREARANFKCSQCGAPMTVRDPTRTKAAFCMDCTMLALCEDDNDEQGSKTGVMDPES